MIKRTVLLAIVLIVTGLIGVSLTFKDKLNQEQETIRDNVDMSGIDKIEVNAGNSDITLSETMESQAMIEWTGHFSRYDFTYEVEDNTLLINVKTKRFQFFNIDIFSLGVALHVKLPEQLYDSINIKTGNGRITLDNLKVSNINAKTSNGRMILQHLETESSFFKTSNGRINMEDLTGDITAESSNGRITYSIDHIEQNLDFTTYNGAIHIYTDKKPTNITLDAKTSNGSVRVFGEKDWDIMTGNGEYLVKLRSSNGSIKISDE